MRERGIIFSSVMVGALLVGKKTQTRRVCKQQPYPNGTWNVQLQDFQCHNDYLPPSAMLMDARGKALYTTSDLEGWESECPYGLVGDRLWVRETFFAYGRWETRYSEKKKRDEWHFIDMTTECGRAYQYAADEPDVPLPTGRGGALPGWYRRPAIFMPRHACRIVDEITVVRVEPLNDCSAEDARAEGIICPLYPIDGGPKSWTLAYEKLWESINGAGSWAANPWVWVVEFKRVAP